MTMNSPSSRKIKPFSRSFLLARYISTLTPCLSWAPPFHGRTHLQATVNSCYKSRFKPISKLFDSGTTIGEFENDDSFEYNYDDANAKSQFGTKEYWDNQYQGRGDFPMDEYQWYYGFERYLTFLQTYTPSMNEEVLIPGIGNDPILLYLLQKGYTKLTATDYSAFAIERQKDLLSYQTFPFSTEIDAASDKILIEKLDCDNDDDVGNEQQRPTTLVQMDAREMPVQWTEKFDTIVEKGTLDAIFLSGDGNANRAANELKRTLRPGGILITMSCVIPVDVRKEIFRNWTWIRDGSEDLDAGCFIFEKPKL